MPIVEPVVQIMTVLEGTQVLNGTLPEAGQITATGLQILPVAAVIIALPHITTVTEGAITAQAAVTTGQGPVVITTRATVAVVPGAVASPPVEVEVGVHPLLAVLPEVGAVPVAVPEEGINPLQVRKVQHNHLER